MLEAGVGIEPTHNGFAGHCITTLLPSQFRGEAELKKGFFDYNSAYKIKTY